MSSASPEGSLTRANPPPPIELISGSVTPTAAAAATAASAALPPARYVSAAASAAYGVPAAAAKVRSRPVVSIIGYYAPSLPPHTVIWCYRGCHHCCHHEPCCLCLHHSINSIGSGLSLVRHA